jgi:hypothetical protein
MRFGSVNALSTGSGRIAQKEHFGQYDRAKLLKESRKWPR